MIFPYLLFFSLTISVQIRTNQYYHDAIIMIEISIAETIPYLGRFGLRTYTVLPRRVGAGFHFEFSM